MQESFFRLAMCLNFSLKIQTHLNRQSVFPARQFVYIFCILFLFTSLRALSASGNGDKCGDKDQFTELGHFVTDVEDVLEKRSGSRSARRPLPARPGVQQLLPQNWVPRRYARTCHAFIDPQGNIGAWGNSMLAAIAETQRPDCFFSGQNLPRQLCPKFNQLGPEGQRRFWAWTFGSMAHVESSCRTSAVARGTNGAAVGLFQLEQSANLRLRSGRDARMCFTSSNPRQWNELSSPRFTRSVHFQSRCTASILVETLCEKNLTLGSPGGYFQKLNGRGSLISQMIRSFPGCN